MDAEEPHKRRDPVVTVVDLVVVGGGPAGMAAALSAANLGVSVVLVEELAELGGQIYRQPPAAFNRTSHKRSPKEAKGRELVESTHNSKVDIRLNTTAYDIGDNTLFVHSPGKTIEILEFKYLVLATGAYDRPLVFPGWTLPGVITAGAAQVLTTTQGVAPGRRVLMAGNGPLALAFAAELHKRGVNVVGVLESAPAPKLRHLVGLALACLNAGQLGLLLEGVGYRAYLWRKRVPLFNQHVLLRATGTSRVESATFTRLDLSGVPNRLHEREISLDTICLGYGLSPSRELWALTGCRESHSEELGGFVPIRNARLETSRPHVFVVGDGAGVNGVDIATAEGEIAGFEIARDMEKVPARSRMARRHPRRLRKLRRMLGVRKALNDVYPIFEAIYSLADSETVVCRCEETKQCEIIEAINRVGFDVNAVKAVTRAGMGRCQGRNCEMHITATVASACGKSIAGMPRFVTRPPARPVPIGALAISYEFESPLPQAINVPNGPE